MTYKMLLYSMILYFNTCSTSVA